MARWRRTGPAAKRWGLEKGVRPPGATTTAALAADLIEKTGGRHFHASQHAGSTCGKKGDIDKSVRATHPPAA